MKIRRFNAAGLARFAEYLVERNQAAPPPRELLEDPQLTEPGPVDAELELQTYESKFDLGLAICASVGGSAQAQQLLNDVAVWAWLSLFYSDSTMPKKDQVWFIGDRSRHMLGANKAAWKEYDHYHRHLVRGAVQTVFRFNDKARVLLGGSAQHTKMEEQLLSRKVGVTFAYSQPLIEVVHRLFWDGPKAKLRRGAASTGPGGIVRLMDVLRQIDVTYDLPSLSAEQLYTLLPVPEFRPHPPAAT